MAATADQAAPPPGPDEPDTASIGGEADAAFSSDARLPEPPAIVAGLAPHAPAAVDSTVHKDRRLLGLPVPDMVPSNDDVARGFRGLGHAVGSLIP
jgi:hypothetical protein